MKNEMDFYQKLRIKANEYVKQHQNSKYVQYIVVLPDLFHLLCRLSIDKRVSFKSKATLGIAILYVMSPADLIFDFIPGIGLMDDVGVVVYAIKKVLNDTPTEIIAEHWAGDGEVFGVLENFLHHADNLIGSGLLEKIKRLFKS